MAANLKHSVTHTHTRTHAHTHMQPFYSSMNFVRDNPGEPVPEETFTHSHLSWSQIVPYLFLPSNTIHGILLVQSTCLTVFFHNLEVFFGQPVGLAPSTSYSIHFFTQSLSSFRITCPYHRSLKHSVKQLEMNLDLTLPSGKQMIGSLGNIVSTCSM